MLDTAPPGQVRSPYRTSIKNLHKVAVACALAYIKYEIDADKLRSTEDRKAFIDGCQYFLRGPRWWMFNPLKFLPKDWQLDPCPFMTEVTIKYGIRTITRHIELYLKATSMIHFSMCLAMFLSSGRNTLASEADAFMTTLKLDRLASPFRRTDQPRTTARRQPDVVNGRTR